MINAKKTLGLVNQRTNLLEEASSRREIDGVDMAEFVIRVLLKIMKSALKNSRGAFRACFAA
jgi:hypothetical protein